MGFTEVIFSTAGVAYPLLAGWGWTFVGRGDFNSAKRCFWFGTLLAAGATVILGTTVDWPVLPRLVVVGAIGAGLLIGATESVRWVGAEVLGQSGQGNPAMSEQPSPNHASSIDKIEQHNQGGQNIGQQNNYYQPMPKPVPDLEVIHQAGAVVGKVFGARRSPTDAMVYEFTEIKNSSQFNAQAGFEYDGLMLAIQSVRSRVGLDISRPQDGMVYGGVIARVVGKAPQ
jgi:hypothetical protein